MCGAAACSTHHSPPEGVGVAGEVSQTGVVRRRGVVLLGQVDEVRREDEAEEPDVERRYQLLHAHAHDEYITEEMSYAWRFSAVQ